jgi:hypothetical protein
MKSKSPLFDFGGREGIRAPDLLWYAKIPSGSHLTEMLVLIVRLSRARKPQKPILRTENASQPGRPCAILTAHVSILSEHKALTGFSAYLDHRSGSGRASFLPFPVPLAHIPERGGSVPAKATGLL